MLISKGGRKRIILLVTSESFRARHSDFEDNSKSFLYYISSLYRTYYIFCFRSRGKLANVVLGNDDFVTQVIENLQTYDICG